MRPGIRGNGTEDFRGSQAYYVGRIPNGQTALSDATWVPLPGRRHARLQAETWLGKIAKGKIHEQPTWDDNGKW